MKRYGKHLATFVLALALLGWAVAEYAMMRHSSPVTWVGFTPDGTELWSISGLGSVDPDMSLRRWSLPGGWNLSTLDLQGEPAHALPAKGIVAANARGTWCQMFDVATGTTGKRVGQERSMEGGLSALQLVPGGQLAICCRTAVGDGTMTVFDVATGEELRTMGGDIVQFADVTVSGDGRFIATAEAHHARVWSLEDGTEIARFAVDRQSFGPARTENLGAVALNSYGTLLAAGSRDGDVWLFDPSTKQMVRKLPYPDGVASLRFDASGQRLAAGGKSESSRAIIWSIPDGATLATVSSHRGAIRALSFSPDGRKLATGGDDGKVRVCSIP